jgi:acetoin utilization protein AcuB
LDIADAKERKGSRRPQRPPNLKTTEEDAMLIPTLQVRDAMTFMPDTIKGNVTLAEALHMMRVNRYRHLPVTVGGTAVGLVSDRDLKWALSLGLPESTPVSEVMTEVTGSAKPNDALADVLDAFIDHKQGSALVTSPAGEVVGIVTTTDLARILQEILSQSSSRKAGRVADAG